MTHRLEYAIKILMELTLLPQGRAMTLGQIGEKHGLSPKYLWLVASSLKKAGLLRGVRGAGGGFRLARPASSITLADAFNVTEGTGLADEVPTATGRDPVANEVVDETWKGLHQAWQKILSQTTIEQLAERYRRKTGSRMLEFVI